jgi:hypothetical protein
MRKEFFTIVLICVVYLNGILGGYMIGHRHGLKDFKSLNTLEYEITIKNCLDKMPFCSDITLVEKK